MVSKFLNQKKQKILVRWLRIINPELLLFGVALVFVFVASLNDLVTKEVSNKIVFCTFVAGILVTTFLFITTKDVNYFLHAYFGLLGGLLVGITLFFCKGWGGGDAKLVVGLGFLLGINPYNLLAQYGFINFLIVFSIVNLVYSTIYFCVYKNYKIFGKNWRLQELVSPQFLTVGDFVVGMKGYGVSKAQILELKNKKKRVWLKFGVPLIPCWFFSMLWIIFQNA